MPDEPIEANSTDSLDERRCPGCREWLMFYEADCHPARTR